MPTSDTTHTDHDGLFKELIRTFTFEFIALFAPKLAQDLVPNSFEFLDKELIQLLDLGERKEVDLLIKCRMKAKEVFFLIHIEPQADSRKWSSERMFLYTMRIFERHRLPIYPMALLTWDTPKKPAEDQFGFSFSDLDVLSFRFRTIQLNRINWRTFLMQDNPVAAALMSKMQIPKAERPQVKVELMRMLATLRLNPTKSALIYQFMINYLRLNAEEEQKAQETIKKILPPEIQEQAMIITNEWIEKGLEKGKLLAQRTTNLRLISRRFGEAAATAYRPLIESLTPSESDQFFDVALFFTSEADLESWFSTRSAPE